MINLKDNQAELINLGTTIKALRDFNHLIAYYRQDRSGPAYLAARHVVGLEGIEFQLDRGVMIGALEEQRQRVIDYLATLGIDASDYTEV